MPWGNIATGILPISKKTCRVMLQKRSPNVDEGGTWGLVGGAIGESGNFMRISQFDRLSKQEQLDLLVKNNQQEMEEEIGVKPDFESPQIFYPFESQDKKFRYYNMIGTVNDEFEPQNKSWESEGVKWIHIDELIHFDKYNDKERLHSKLKEAILSDENETKIIRQYFSECNKNKK